MSTAPIIKSWLDKNKESKYWLGEIINTKEIETILSMSTSVIDGYFKYFTMKDKKGKNVMDPFPDVRIAEINDFSVTEIDQINDLYLNQDTRESVLSKLF
jgi:hypothetical protein